MNKLLLRLKPSLSLISEVNAQEKNIEISTVTIGALSRKSARANIRTNPLPPKAWRLQGYAYHKDNSPASGVTIFFVDGNQQWIRSLGNACTYETGYYSVTVDEKVIGAVGKQPLYLSVSDINKIIIYHATEPIYCSKGFIYYTDIYLSDSDSFPPPVFKRIK